MTGNSKKRVSETMVFTGHSTSASNAAPAKRVSVGVDVARFKSEFLSDYYLRHGVPLKARALGNVHRAAIWGSRFAPLSNKLASSKPAAG